MGPRARPITITRSSFNPGDVQQVALQATNACRGTGRYSYSIQLVDYGIHHDDHDLQRDGHGPERVEQRSGRRLGARRPGTDHHGPGGVILDLGGGDSSLWFTGSPGSGGGTYTSPARRLHYPDANANGSYTRTLPTARDHLQLGRL